MTPLAGNWQFWAFMAAFFAAMTAILAKAGVDDINPDTATFVRTIVVVIALGMLLLFTRQLQSLGSVSVKSGAFLVLSGLATGASWLCYFRALKLGTASQVAPVDKLSVVMVAVFAALFLGERLSPSGWLGVLMVGAGATIIAAS